jgi:2'-5' RNA ligase
LARLKGAPSHRVADFLGEVGKISTQTFAVDAFVLYSSQLSRSGAIYRVEAVYSLRPE